LQDRLQESHGRLLDASADTGRRSNRADGCGGAGTEQCFTVKRPEKDIDGS
jgi:hypothetical protein